MPEYKCTHTTRIAKRIRQHESRNTSCKQKRRCCIIHVFFFGFLALKTTEMFFFVALQLLQPTFFVSLGKTKKKDKKKLKKKGGMSVPPDRNVGTTSCAENEDQVPPATPQSLIESQSMGLGAIIDALGITSCKTALVEGSLAFPPFTAGAELSVGCEQIALLASQMNAAQKVIQCSLFSLSQSTSTTAVQNCTINFNTSNVTLSGGCTIEFKQVSDMYVFKYAEMTSEIKQKITSSVTNAMDGFIKSVQDQTEKGLFPKSDGQKVVQEMSQNLNNMIENDAITNIVQQEIESYTNTGVINISLNSTQVLGNWNPNSSGNCITVNQSFLMNVLSQSILSSTLDQVMSGDAKNDMKQVLENAQTQDLEGVQSSSWILIAVVVAIAIVAMVLVFSKKSGGNEDKSESVLAGKVGTIFGSILLVIGVALFLTGLILKLRKKTNAILCYLMMAGGAILMIVAIVLIVKSRSQQLRFEQNLAVAKAKNAKTSLLN